MLDATVFVALVLTLYFLPTVIAWNRNHEGMVKIFLLNFLFGWTVIGWIGALLWSVSSSAAVPAAAPAVLSAKEDDSEERIRCPECAELILKMAKVCKHCGHKIARPAEHEDASA